MGLPRRRGHRRQGQQVGARKQSRQRNRRRRGRRRWPCPREKERRARVGPGHYAGLPGACSSVRVPRAAPGPPLGVALLEAVPRRRCQGLLEGVWEVRERVLDGGGWCCRLEGVREVHERIIGAKGAMLPLTTPHKEPFGQR